VSLPDQSALTVKANNAKEEKENKRSVSTTCLKLTEQDLRGLIVRNAICFWSSVTKFSPHNYTPLSYLKIIRDACISDEKLAREAESIILAQKPRATELKAARYLLWQTVQQDLAARLRTLEQNFAYGCWDAKSPDLNFAGDFINLLLAVNVLCKSTTGSGYEFTPFFQNYVTQGKHDDAVINNILHFNRAGKSKILGTSSEDRARIVLDFFKRQNVLADNIEKLLSQLATNMPWLYQHNHDVLANSTDKKLSKEVDSVMVVDCNLAMATICPSSSSSNTSSSFS
jgi:hypothetical protein